MSDDRVRHLRGFVHEVVALGGWRGCYEEAERVCTIRGVMAPSMPLAVLSAMLLAYFLLGRFVRILADAVARTQQTCLRSMTFSELVQWGVFLRFELTLFEWPAMHFRSHQGDRDPGRCEGQQEAGAPERPREHGSVFERQLPHSHAHRGNTAGASVYVCRILTQDNDMLS